VSSTNSILNARKTHCDQGHELTPENTYCGSSGGRNCRECRRRLDREAKRRRRARLAAQRKRPPVILGLPARVWARLVPKDCGYETPCLVWTGTLSADGYGVVGIGRRQFKVHRLVYEAVRGPMPEHDGNGKRIVSDHLCRHHACANPEHIEPVTDAVNVMRGESFSPANAAKTHCDSGHEFTPDNTAIDAEGYRICRICRRIRGRKSDEKRRPKKQAAA
jgi:hypothetical protein